MITVLGKLKKGNVYAKNMSIELEPNEAFDIKSVDQLFQTAAPGPQVFSQKSLTAIFMDDLF